MSIGTNFYMHRIKNLVPRSEKMLLNLKLRIGFFFHYDNNVAHLGSRDIYTATAHHREKRRETLTINIIIVIIIILLLFKLFVYTSVCTSRRRIYMNVRYTI